MRSIRTIAFTAVAILSTAFLSAAETRQNFDRTSNYDVQHYTIRASFDASKKTVFGDTIVTLKPTQADFRRLELDAVDLKFSKVTLEGSNTDLKYKTSGGKVIVDLDRAYAVGQSIAVRFAYTTIAPKKGVYFVDASAEGDSPKHSSQIWSQGEAEEARYWFPSFDFPSDKATTEEYITAAADEQVVGNGELIGKSDLPDGRVEWHYKMPVPHSTYLVSFVIGKYSAVNETYGNIPLTYYVYPGSEAIVPKAYGKTKDVLRVYEELTGVKFPYNKYDQTVVANFQFGGMENITATTMADTEVALAIFPFGVDTVEDLVSHEAAHSWFGDLVTCKNWAELWLNEGFATYMEAAYREKMYGRGAYLKAIKNDAETFMDEDAVDKERHGLFNRRAGNVDALFDRSGTTYNKGGVVLHMLRETVGDKVFWAAIHNYLEEHKYGNVETTDLKRAMEQESSQDLTWFFDQWVYATGSPKITVKQSYSRSQKKLTLTVTQTQKAADLTPLAFRLPFDLEIITPQRILNEKLNVTKRVETFVFDVPGKPTSFVVDKDLKIPVKSLIILPPAETK